MTLGAIGTSGGSRTASLFDSTSRLSSGKRISRAADDPAGLALAAQLSSQVRSRGVEARTLGDKISALSIAGGGLNSIQGLAQRQLELATRAANGTLSDAQRGALQQEYRALSEERERIVATTEFNGQKLLDGSFSVSLGGEGDAGTLTISPVPSTSSNIGTREGALVAIASTRALSETATQTTADIGQFLSRAGTAIEGASANALALLEAQSRIEDQDIAGGASELAQSIAQTDAAVLLQAQAANLSASNAAALLA